MGDTLYYSQSHEDFYLKATADSFKNDLNVFDNNLKAVIIKYLNGDRLTDSENATLMRMLCSNAHSYLASTLLTDIISLNNNQKLPQILALSKFITTQL